MEMRSTARNQNYNNHDLEERANHLFEFLLITVASTIGFPNVNLPLFKVDPKKRKSFR